MVSSDNLLLVLQDQNII